MKKKVSVRVNGWTAQDYKAIKGLKRNDKQGIKEVAKQIGRSYAAVYTKVWAKEGKKGYRVTTQQRILNAGYDPQARVRSKVRMTRSFVIIRDYKSMSIVNGALRVKL